MFLADVLLTFPTNDSASLIGCLRIGSLDGIRAGVVSVCESDGLLGEYGTVKLSGMSNRTLIKRARLYSSTSILRRAAD